MLRLADVDQLVVLRSYAFLSPTLLPAPWFPHALATELVVDAGLTIPRAME